MKTTLCTFFLFAFFLFPAQKSRNVGDFQALKVYDKITVELINSEKPRVETSSADVETLNKNGELKIRMAPAKVLQGGQTTVKVYYDTLTDIQVSQGSKITAAEELQAKNLSLTANEGSVLQLDLQVEKLTSKTNSAGEIKVRGSAARLDAVSNTGGKFLGADLEVLVAEVAANAGGLAEVNVSGEITATTRAGGIIDVFGDPEERSAKTVLGGNINFK